MSDVSKTSYNDSTGDLIKSRPDSQEKYAIGWDAIFGKKENTEEQNKENK